jgi:outer membrane immunogenic protein
MARISTIVVAAGLSIGLCQITRGADLPAYASYSAPEVAPFLWTGCYVGGNAGGTWTRLDIANASTGNAISVANSGFAVGLQLGCDYQMDGLVVGFRNLYDWTSLKSSATFQNAPLVGYSGNSNTSWFDILTARLGYAVQPNWLFYFQGGGIWTRSNQWINDPTGVQVAQIGNNRGGWTVGIGTEYMLSPRWSAFVEYNYVNLGANTVSVTDAHACVAGCAVDVLRDSQNILVGLNFHFGGFY